MRSSWCGPVLAAAPTVLRGSLPRGAAEICPKGYALTPSYGCRAPAATNFADTAPEYQYWPNYGSGRGYGLIGAVGPARQHGPRHFKHAGGFRGFAGSRYRLPAGEGHMANFTRR